MKRKTNYFCTTCYKTYAEYWDGSKIVDKKGTMPVKGPLHTGKCDNTDQTNPLVKGKICGGELKVA